VKHRLYTSHNVYYVNFRGYLRRRLHWAADVETLLSCHRIERVTWLIATRLAFIPLYTLGRDFFEALAERKADFV
jgi:hypothetical protein